MPVQASEMEIALNSPKSDVRQRALQTAMAAMPETSPKSPPVLNLHCHTFFSFNGYGYSPSFLAWKSRLDGLYAVGIVDFDVLDAVDEFLAGARLLGIRHCAGIETRIFLPEFETREINSPGEPGIAYHMGVGFTSGAVRDAAFMASLKDTAQARNRDVVTRVNAFLPELALDYDADVVPLTPKGNATERHVCRAYDEKSQHVFSDKSPRVAYWSEKLKSSDADLAKLIDDAPNFQGLIRSKLIKSGGPGYVKPEPKSFPLLKRFNEFVLSAGAIPTCAWLDGTTPGEQAMEELLAIQMTAGVAAINIIPDRNWNIKDPAQKAVKVKNLNDVIALAKRLGLPVFVGTEMNAHGQRFVDDFSVPEMAQHLDTFIEGANIAYAHTVLEGAAGMGYLSDWATRHFSDVHAKNRFYAEFGAAMSPSISSQGMFNVNMTPDTVMGKARNGAR
jgi:hypothetical protein